MGTQRTQEELDALFIDNIVKRCTPAMIRDLIESAVPSHGALHFNDPGTPTTITTPSTWVKAANVTTHTLLHRFSMTDNNRLQYTGITQVQGLVNVSMSVTSVANNQNLAFAIFKNGSLDVPSIMRTKVASSDVQSVCLHTALEINPSDYFELYMMNETGANNITINHALVSVMAYIH